MSCCFPVCRAQRLQPSCKPDGDSQLVGREQCGHRHRQRLSCRRTSGMSSAWKPVHHQTRLSMRRTPLQRPTGAFLVQGRVVALQALSGTGSLRVGAAFIAKFLPGTKVYLSNPTWGNHNNIFADAGVPAEKYRCLSGSARNMATPFRGRKHSSITVHSSLAIRWYTRWRWVVR